MKIIRFDELIFVKLYFSNRYKNLLLFVLTVNNEINGTINPIEIDSNKAENIASVDI